jgi:ribosomal protein S5
MIEWILLSQDSSGTATGGVCECDCLVMLCSVECEPSNAAMFRRTLAARKSATPLFDRGDRGTRTGKPNTVKGSMVGGVPRVYYGWMRPGSETRRRFEKMRNPFVDLEAGTSVFYRDTRDPVEAMRQEADAAGLKGMDNAVDLYNEYRIVPDLYPEGFQWQHKLNTEYNQWRSNTWMTPELIPAEHRGRFLCSFQVNVVHFTMRVARFAPKDSRQWIYCSLYVGSGKGIAGFGQAVAPNTAEAKKEAIKVAFQNIVAVNLEDEGPMYPIRLYHEGKHISLYPCNRLSGSSTFVDVLCAFGFIGAGVKVNRRRRDFGNYADHIQGIFRAIDMLRSTTEIAHQRGKVPSSLVSNIFPYLEEVRRRKGMFAMHPSGKDGTHLTPNRVVDNRLPDHLKKTYYDDKFWKDFFAGSKDRLNDHRIGMRPDELRALVPSTKEKPPMALLAASRGQGGRRRRTLSDVLNRLGRRADTLGVIKVVNPYVDAKVPTHAKNIFHLH